jgi:hypothetical protein
MSNIYKRIKDFLDGKKEIPEVEQEIEQEIIKIENEISLKPFEEKLNHLYMGCYDDDPNKPIMTNNLGNIQNQLDCIKAGQETENKYIGLQSGNECLGSKNLNFQEMTKVPRTNCNSVCNEASAGFCGGILKNQIYATTLEQAIKSENNTMNEKFKELENFYLHDKEMKLISKNISQADMLCQEPINKYNLFLTLLIMLLLLYILMEYIYKK